MAASGHLQAAGWPLDSQQVSTGCPLEWISMETYLTRALPTEQLRKRSLSKILGSPVHSMSFLWEPWAHVLLACASHLLMKTSQVKMAPVTPSCDPCVLVGTTGQVEHRTCWKRRLSLCSKTPQDSKGDASGGAPALPVGGRVADLAHLCHVGIGCDAVEESSLSLSLSFCFSNEFFFFLVLQSF